MAEKEYTNELEQAIETAESVDMPEVERIEVADTFDVIIENEPFPYQNHYVASFKRRLVAYLIDLLMISSITAMIISDVISNPLWSFMMTTTLHCGYFAILNYVFKGQTIGKMIMRLRAVNFDGSVMDIKSIFYREVVARVIQQKYAFIYLLALFSPYRLQLGDYIANTCVVRDDQ